MSGKMTAAAAGALAVATGGTAVWALRHHRHWRQILTDRIPVHHDYWRERGRPAGDSLLYAALGDSAALGIGASQPSHGYVALIARELGRRTGRTIRVRNLSIDGATLAVCIREELPRLQSLRPDVCTVAIGANDMWTFDAARFEAELEVLLDALPAGSIVGEIPSFAPVPIGRRVRRANALIRAAAARHGFAVAPVHATTSRGGPAVAIRNAAGDLFHPNDRGHVSWAAAFIPAVDRIADTIAPSRS